MSIYICLIWCHSEANPKNNWMRGRHACLKGGFKSWLVTIKYDRFDSSYHCNFFDGFQSSHHYWMEWLRATIKFGGFSMVFGSPTIVFDGLWWLSTIRQTMRWSHTIAPVLSGHSTAFAIPCDVFENVNKMIWGRDVFFCILHAKCCFGGEIEY